MSALRPVSVRRSRGAARVSALFGSVILAAAAVTGCSSGSPGGTPDSVAAATVAPSSGATLDVLGFAAALKRPGTVVLDVRTRAEYAAGHLAGARNIDVEAADFPAKIAALPKDSPYAVYCRSGNRSATALAIMQKAGFTSVYHLGGGINAWTQAGGVTTKG